MPIIHLACEAQTVRNVLLDAMRAKEFVTPTIAAERIHLLFDPGRKLCRIRCAPYAS